MNLYDNYSDLFLLWKLVDASRTPWPRAIRLEWSFEMNVYFYSNSFAQFVVIVSWLMQ